MLGSRLGYSCWRLVTGYVCAVRRLPLILHNRWSALTAQVSQSTISYTNARLTRALLAGTDRIHGNSYTNTRRPTVPTVGQTMQVGNNYLSGGHLPPERPQIDGQLATECRHAVHHMQITRALILWRVWQLVVAVFSPMPPAGRPPTSPTATAVGDMGGHLQWLVRIWL